MYLFSYSTGILMICDNDMYPRDSQMNDSTLMIYVWFVIERCSKWREPMKELETELSFISFLASFVLCCSLKLHPRSLNWVKQWKAAHLTSQFIFDFWFFLCQWCLYQNVKLAKESILIGPNKEKRHIKCLNLQSLFKLVRSTQFRWKLLVDLNKMIIRVCAYGVCIKKWNSQNLNWAKQWKATQ